MNIDDPVKDEIWNNLSRLNVDGFSIADENLDINADGEGNDLNYSNYSDQPRIQRTKRRMHVDEDQAGSELTKYITDSFNSRCYIVKEQFVNGSSLVKQLKMS